MHADGFARARGLADWKRRVRESWSDVQVIDVDGDLTAAEVGEERHVAATIRVGRLSTDDLSVQLAHGRVGANNELITPRFAVMQSDYCEEGTCIYRGSFTTEEAGLYGYAVRVTPRHEDVTNALDLGLLTWA
jgi:starch phosphorylase